PYVIVAIVLALLALPFTKVNFRNFHFLWVIPLIFMVVTTNFFQLFFLVSPQSVVSLALQVEHNVMNWRLIAQFLIVVVWQVFAWRLVYETLKRKKIPSDKLPE